MKKKLAIILFFSFFVFGSLSQPFSDWKNYSYNQNVTGIEIRGNYLWISTQGGLIQYNKNTGEKVYYNRANANLPDNNLFGVCSIGNDEDAVWIASTNYGIGKLKDGQCISYNMANSGLPSDQHNRKIERDKNGNLWIASFSSMVKFDGTNWITWETGSPLSSFPVISGFDIDSSRIVWVYSTDGIGKIENDEYAIFSDVGSGLNAKTGCVKVDKEQNVWFAIANSSLYKLADSKLTLHNTSNTCLPTMTISDISFDIQNRMWLCTSEGLVQYNDAKCLVYPAPEPLFRIEAASNDTVWCGTLGGKLLCFDGENYKSIDISNSPLADNIVTAIHIDNNDNKWISTRKNISLKTKEQFKEFYKKPAVAFISDNNGVTWIAFYTNSAHEDYNNGDTSLIKISNAGTEVFTSNNSPFTPGIQINSLATDAKNNLWISSNNGIFVFDGETFTNYNTGNSSIPSNYIGLIIFDNTGNLWGTLNGQGISNGLCKFDGSTWTVWNTSNSKIPTNIVSGMDVDSENNLWFSCMDEERIVGREYGGGLTCFDGNSMKTYNIYNSGLLCNTIFDVYVDRKDKIWLATSVAGLMNFDMKDKWKSFNTGNSGIAHNWVQQIKQDKEGNLWLGHPGAGVSVYIEDTLISNNSLKQHGSSFQIYPNPVSDILMINYSGNSKEEVIVEIFDINGRIIKKWNLQNICPENPFLKLNVLGLINENQVYILRVTSDKKQTSQKFLYKKI